MSDGPKVSEWRGKQEVEHARDWRELMKQPWGRRLVMHFIESTRYCGAYRSTFDTDLARASYRSGQRDVGLALVAAAQNTDFELYDRMIGESANDRRAFLIAQKSDEETKES